MIRSGVDPVSATVTPRAIATGAVAICSNADKPSTNTGTQLTKRRAPKASPAHQSATHAFTYQDATKNVTAATPMSGARRTSGTNPASASATIGVQVTSPWSEKMTD